MNSNISNLDNTRKFLVNYLQGKTCNYEVTHPWRKGWEFVVQHSFRVESYVSKILLGEKHNLSQKEVEVLRIAAILHDIGRIDDRKNHAVYGAGISRKWLKEDGNVELSKESIDRCVYMIEKHSDKESYEPDLCSRILKDADILDEIGVMSIFMASSWVNRGSYFFFNELLERVEGFELEFCDKELDKLNTETAKKLLIEKRKFIVLFANQLKNELNGTECIEEFIGEGV